MTTAETPPRAELAEQRRAVVLMDPRDRALVDRWLDPNERSAHTVRLYRRVATEAYGIIAKPLHEWTLGDLHAYLELVHDARSRTTFELTRDVLRSLLRYAHAAGRIESNPGAFLKSRRLKKSLAARLLSREEVYMMHARAATQRDRALIRFLYVSGLRVAEVAATRWHHIRELEGGGATLTVRKKGGDEYDVGIPKPTFLELRALPRYVRAGLEHDVALFTSRRKLGKPLDVRSIHLAVTRTAKLAGIERPIAPHFFRHSHASHAVKMGASLPLISGQLGHSSFAVTSRYVHLDPTSTSAHIVEL